MSDMYETSFFFFSSDFDPDSGNNFRHQEGGSSVGSAPGPELPVLGLRLLHHLRLLHPLLGNHTPPGLPRTQEKTQNGLSRPATVLTDRPSRYTVYVISSMQEKTVI